MIWYRNPYFGKTAEKSRERIMRKLEEESGWPFLLLITLPATKENQLEILSPGNYRRQAARKGETLIVGAAVGMREAKRLVEQIVGDVYRQTGTANVREYFAKSDE